MMFGSPSKKAWPALRSDAAVERFAAEADLTEYDFPQMVPVWFELRRKGEVVSLRLSDALLEAVKRSVARQGIPDRRFIPQAIEQAVAPEKAPQR